MKTINFYFPCPPELPRDWNCVREKLYGVTFKLKLIPQGLRWAVNFGQCKMLKWQSIGFHFSALNFASTFQTKTHPNKEWPGLCHVSLLLLRLSHRYKERGLSIYQISETFDKDAEMAKRNLFVTFTTRRYKARLI